MTLGDQIKHYILDEYLPDTDPSELTSETPLIQSGILDSLATLNLRAWLEDTFGIELENHELSLQHFGTLASIEALVASKGAVQG